MHAKDFWGSLTLRARVAMAAGAGAIALSLAASISWILRPDYQVLFTDLKAQDTAAMAAELEHLKVPFKVGEDGTTILVDAPIVYSTRLKLMGKDLPLHGAAGFELFNNADFGMTEFAQKINYQRALQGEITRTILSLSEVRDARVHLALPEEGLFQRKSSKAKAAITLALKPGEGLRPEQVTGIQRLVAAAVPGIAAQDVTIVSQQGIALTRTGGGDADLDAGAGRLDLKRDTEKMLVRKATDVLENAFGAGQVLASVDVTLSMDQVRVTTEDVLGTPGRNTGESAGVIVRERETLRDVGPPLGRGDASAGTSNSQHEVEYQVGRRVEQVATQPGAIRQLHVVAVVRQPLDAKQLEQTRELVAAAVGAVPERGDRIVVQTLHAFGSTPPHDPPPDAQHPAPVHFAVAKGARQPSSDATLALGAIAVVAGTGIAAALAWRARRARTGALEPGQRDALLAQVQGWMSRYPMESERGAKGGRT